MISLNFKWQNKSRLFLRGLGVIRGQRRVWGVCPVVKTVQVWQYALELHENMTYTLKRESLSGHNEIETLTGPLRFNAQDQHKVELVNVTTRNLLYVDLEDRVLEIREDADWKKIPNAE